LIKINKTIKGIHQKKKRGNSAPNESMEKLIHEETSGQGNMPKREGEALSVTQ